MYKNRRVLMMYVCVSSCMLLLHHMTRPGSILEGFRYTYVKVNPARVRIWVISTVTAPNKHKSCKSCSSRTRPSVTAKAIAAVYSIKMTARLVYIYMLKA